MVRWTGPARGWTIATAQDTRGGVTATDMYLWQPSTGTLDLWTDLGVNGNALTTTGMYTIPSSALPSILDDPADPVVLRAASIKGDGTPDLWATDTKTGHVTAVLPTALPSGSAGSLTVTAVATALPLDTADHTWYLNDATSSGSAVTTAHDTPQTGTAEQDMTAYPADTTGALWTTGDLFSPDVTLGSDAYLATSSSDTTGGVLDLSGSFSVSVWAKPAAYGGSVLAQLGSAYAGMTIQDTTTGWLLSLNTGNGSSNGTDSIRGGTVQLGTWAQIEATYNATNGVTDLYVDSQSVATGLHTAPSSAADGATTVGYDGSAYFTGQVAQVQVWNSVQDPVPAPTHTWALNEGSGTTAYDSVAGNNLTLNSGAGWTSTTSPDLTFDGSTGGYAQSAAAPVNLAGDYTVSAWVDPFAVTGTALSISGTDDSALTIYPTTTGWDVGLNAAGTTAATYDTLDGAGSVTEENWTQLTFTYNATTGIGELYLDGVPDGTVTDTAAPSVSGPLVLGTKQSSGVTGALGAVFDGAVADVQTWNEIVPPEADLALNQTATASTTFGGLPASNAVNGLYDNFWSSVDTGSATDAQWLQVDLGSVQPVAEVDLTPRQAGLAFPSAFTIATSTDGSTWTSQVTESGVNTTAAGTGNATQRFTFAPVDARYIRVTAATLTTDNGGDYFFQLNQLAAYPAATAPSAAYSTWNTELPPGTDLALNQTATASSTFGGLPTSNAVNGSYTGVWSSTDPGGASDPEWFEVDLGSAKTVDEVDLAARAPNGYCFPSAFTIAVSTDNTNWTTVTTESGYANPYQVLQRFPFAPTSARYIKVTANTLTVDNNNNYYFQLSQLAAF